MLRVHRAKTPFERCVAQSTIIRWTFGDCECTVKFLLKLEEITGKPFRELFGECEGRR